MKEYTEKQLLKEHIERRSLKGTLTEYISKVDAIEKLYRKTTDLENLIEALDKDIEELDDAGLDRTVEILCKTRNSLNLERLKIEIHICKLKLWLAEFELERQLAR